jgi:hypothetical protein
MEKVMYLYIGLGIAATTLLLLHAGWRIYEHRADKKYEMTLERLRPYGSGCGAMPPRRKDVFRFFGLYFTRDVLTVLVLIAAINVFITLADHYSTH